MRILKSTLFFSLQFQEPDPLVEDLEPKLIMFGGLSQDDTNRLFNPPPKLPEITKKVAEDKAVIGQWQCQEFWTVKE